MSFTSPLSYRVIDGKIDPVIGRDEEISRVIRVLARRTKNNPVLIGEPGVGKTAIVEGLAHRIVAGDVPTVIQGCRIMSLDMGSLIAGAKFQGEFEERLKKVWNTFIQITVSLEFMGSTAGASFLAKFEERLKKAAIAEILRESESCNHGSNCWRQVPGTV